MAVMEKEDISMDEYAGMHPTHAALTHQSFQPLGRHDLDKVQESHGVFDHSDGRLVVDPEEAKIEVSYSYLKTSNHIDPDAIVAAHSMAKRSRPS
ncbi:hypothetical protein QFC19_003383 [Naganishia cerealis]|uniref:Uncharacterized protein n=1 Tax=Naganishia cerealis TaxID=610337 RepID=A0ACC2W3C8_9TREE|nr:hypothetical protein QFC19_003383 [Naganishia cerealis]